MEDAFEILLEDAFAVVVAEVEDALEVSLEDTFVVAVMLSLKAETLEDAFEVSLFTNTLKNAREAL